MKRVLVCEDEDSIREFVVINLVRSGYEVVDVNCGEDALKAYDEKDGGFDVALLDIMMPGIDGMQVCKKIREKSNTIGIIMLSAKSQEMDKISCLMSGADDYITKPFSISELIARVDAVCRRVILYIAGYWLYDRCVLGNHTGRDRNLENRIVSRILPTDHGGTNRKIFRCGRYFVYRKAIGI